MEPKEHDVDLENILYDYSEIIRQGTPLTLKWLHEQERKLDNNSFRIMSLYGLIGMSNILSQADGIIPCLEDNVAGYINGKFNHYSQKVAIELHKDNLTGLGNKASLEDFLKRYDPSRELTAIFVDVDKFKEINDTNGHSFGDDVLRYVGEAIAKYTRDCDVKVRCGGDEYVICVTDEEETPPNRIGLKSRYEHLDSLRNRIISYVNKKIEKEDPGKQVQVGLSLGMATSDGTCSPAELVKRADNAMYYAKEGGGDERHVHIYSPEIDAVGLYMQRDERKGR